MIKIKGMDNHLTLFSYLTVIYILLFSGSGIQVVSTRLSSYLLIAVTLILLFLFILRNRISVTFFVPVILIFGIICTMIVTDDTVKFDSYIVLICIIISGYILSMSNIQQKIFSAYSNVIYVIAIIGIVGYLLVNSGIGLPFEQIQISDSGLYKYHTIYIFNYIEGLAERNCGAFWEPGIFASHLILAIQYEIFSRRKNVLRLLIEIIAVITCNSSAGFFLLIIVFAELLASSDKNAKYKSLKAVIGVIVILVLFIVALNIDSLVYYFNLQNNPYIEKLLSDNIKNSTRFLSLEYNWEMFLQQPIFGNGLTNAVKSIPFANLTPDTTTFLFMLNAFGLIGSLFTILTIKGTMGLKFLTWYEKILLLSTVIIILNKETHYAMLLSWFMIFNFSFGSQWKDLSTSLEEEG